MMEKYFDLTGTDSVIRCKMYFNADDRGADPSSRVFRHVILFCHGFAGHRDNAAAQKLAGRILEKTADTALLIFNWPGHGDDSHEEIYLQDCDAYLRRVLCYIQETLRPEVLDVCATSFGGYLILKYISDQQASPFRRICLRCPAVVMDQVLEQTILTPEELGTIKNGGRVPAGFDRKVYLTRAFMDSLHEVGLADRDLHGFADRILIVQGTADEVVPYEAVRGFADRNGLRLLSVEGADHRFLDPAKMDIVLNSFMEHLGI